MVLLSTCKELGSYNSVLTSKQLNTLKMQEPFLDLQERGGPRAPEQTASPRPESQVADAGSDFPEHSPVQKQSLFLGASARLGKAHLELTNCRRLRVDRGV